MGIRDTLKGALGAVGLGSKQTHLNEGDPAPELGVPDASGKRWTLADLRGKPAVLYFYPKDDTPGCTKEACAFRDHYPRLSDATLLGASMDAAEAHHAFAKKYNLPFPLLVDADGDLARRWGVAGGFGGMARRVTFVLDREGRIARIFNPVSVGGHADEVLAAVREAGLR